MAGHPRASNRGEPLSVLDPESPGEAGLSELDRGHAVGKATSQGLCPSVENCCCHFMSWQGRSHLFSPSCLLLAPRIRETQWETREQGDPKCQPFRVQVWSSWWPMWQGPQLKDRWGRGGWVGEEVERRPESLEAGGGDRVQILKRVKQPLESRAMVLKWDQSATFSCSGAGVQQGRDFARWAGERQRWVGNRVLLAEKCHLAKFSWSLNTLPSPVGGYVSRMPQTHPLSPFHLLALPVWLLWVFYFQYPALIHEVIILSFSTVYSGSSSFHHLFSRDVFKTLGTGTRLCGFESWFCHWAVWPWADA